MKEVERRKEGGRKEGQQSQNTSSFAPQTSHFSRVRALWFTSLICVCMLYLFFLILSRLLTMLHCYPELRLRTQEGRRVVTRCLFQRALQGRGDGPLVVFAISAAIELAPSRAYTHKRTRFCQGSLFFNTLVIRYSNV